MSSCGQSFAPAADTTTLDESGLSLADHAGATLVILDLSPARLGNNTARVRLRDPGGRLIGGSAQLSLRRGDSQLATVNLTANTGEGRLGIDGADDYELVVDAAPRGEPSGTVHFAVRLPAEPASASLLQRVDTTMNQLRGLRESQTLTSGAFVYVFSFDYQSPDRTHYSFTGPEGMRHETLLIGTRRFDRQGPGRRPTSSSPSPPPTSPTPTALTASARLAARTLVAATLSFSHWSAAPRPLSVTTGSGSTRRVFRSS